MRNTSLKHKWNGRRKLSHLWKREKEVTSPEWTSCLLCHILMLPFSLRVIKWMSANAAEEAKYVLDVDDYCCVTIRTRGTARAKEEAAKYTKSQRSKESTSHVANVNTSIHKGKCVFAAAKSHSSQVTLPSESPCVHCYTDDAWNRWVFILYSKALCFLSVYCRVHHHHQCHQQSVSMNASVLEVFFFLSLSPVTFYSLWFTVR